jgi:hypothetical protein
MADREGNPLILAGYQWHFFIWFRDSLASFPGLFLIPKKFAEAKQFLNYVIQFEKNGIIPLYMTVEKKNIKYILLSGLATGLAFMSKGPPAFVVPTSIGLYYLITKQFQKLFNKYFILSIFLSIIIPMFWIIPQLIYKGNALYEKFVINQILWSFLGRSVKYNSFTDKIANYLFFFGAFFSYYLPWSITGLWGIKKILKEHITQFYVIIIWVVIVWTGFTLAGYKDDYYLLAFFPGWAIVNGYMFSFWTKNIEKTLSTIFAGLTLVLIISIFFTPIKFDKIRNPEFKIMGKYINSIVPKNEKIITYNLFYYDMVSLLPWYADRGVQESLLPNPNVAPDAKAWKKVSVNTPEELNYFLSSETTKFILIKKKDFESLPKNLQQKIFVLRKEGRFIFGSNKKITIQD